MPFLTAFIILFSSREKEMFPSCVSNRSIINNKGFNEALVFNATSTSDPLPMVQGQDRSSSVTGEENTSMVMRNIQSQEIPRIRVGEVEDLAEALVSLRKMGMKATLELIGQEVINKAKALEALPADIQHLKLSGGDFSKVENLLKLKQLTFLDLKASRFYNLPQLTSLDLSGSRFSDVFLRAILASAPNVTSLNLSDCNILNTVENGALPSLEKLVFLDLSHSTFPAALLTAILASAPNVISLNLSDCDALNAEGPWALPHFKKLTSLDLSHSSLSGGFLRAILASAPYLTSLNLNHCDGLTAASTANLTSLDPSSCNILNAAGRWVLPPLEKLTFLDLSNSRFPDAFLSAILASALNVTSLYLSNCRGLTRQGLTIAKLPRLGKLAFLNLSRSQLSAAFLASVLASAPHVTNLNLSDCDILNTEEHRLLPRLEKLTSLSLSKSRFSNEFRIAILASAPNLISLDVVGPRHSLLQTH